MSTFREVRDAGRFVSDRDARAEAGIELHEPATEPDDIDQVTREDDGAWRDHFRAEREGRDDGLHGALV